MSSLRSVQGPVQAGDEIEIFRIARRHDAVAQREIDIDQIDVELEIVGAAHAFDDILFLYDCETPPDFTPRNADGEIVSFALMDAEDVVERMRRTDDFKFNVNLVNIDFALRHGVVPPGDPEYLDLVTGLHRPLD